MATKNIIRKSVVFNVADPLQRSLYEYATQFTNFSYYIKTLIQRDMDGARIPSKNEKEVASDIDATYIKDLI